MLFHLFPYLKGVLFIGYSYSHAVYPDCGSALFVHVSRLPSEQCTHVAGSSLPSA